MGAIKIVITIERREDGGLRAYSDDVPGFVLSHPDPSAVLFDIGPALETILSSVWGIKRNIHPRKRDGDEMKAKELRFVIDTPNRLSMGRIGEYMIELEKLLGVPVELIEVTQDKDESATSIPAPDIPMPRTSKTK